MPTQQEIDRRYKNIRSRMEREGLDALIVCGNQYAGFEGATFYLSGFEIVHRYVYVVLPLAGEPTLVFPREARWIGDKTKPMRVSTNTGNIGRLNVALWASSSSTNP